MSDTITILTSRGPRLAKRWTAAGIEGYERAKHFSVQALPVGGIRELSALLTELEGEPTKCIIRGRLKASALSTEDGYYCRNLETFEGAPHHWLCLDVDSYELPEGFDLVERPAEAVAHFVETQLPLEFRNASYHWQLSNSAGAPGKERILKAHIWFWLSRPHIGDELERWIRAAKVPVDPTVMRDVQVHFCAAPVIDEGVECPIKVRSGFVDGLLGDEVDLVIPELAEEDRPRKARHEMVVPGDKPGLVGLFCRLYPPARAVDELLGGHFEWEGDSDVRLTWLHGGGSPGGVVITDDGEHFYSSHASDPFEGRAVNSFDMVRQHLFGDQDAGLPHDTPPMDRPSDKAMRAWVKELPDVAAELHTLRRSAAEEWDEFDDSEEVTRAAKASAARVERAERALVARAALKDKVLQSIKEAADTDALKAICATEIADTETFDQADREGILAPAVQDRWTQLTGNRLPIGTARDMVGPARAASNAGAAAPDWLKRWVYVTHLDKFFCLDTKQQASGRGFDALNSMQMPLSNDNIRRESASDWAISVWGIETVDNVTYGPGQPEVFEALGHRWANTYREDSIPVATAPGRAAQMAEAHLKRLIPDDRERGLLLSWMAHNVRHPGKKIRWAPYIWGDEGAGKTFIAEVMGLAMGEQNVRALGGAVLKSDFNSWAAGAAVVVIEEVYQPGYGGWDAVEKLKAPITNNVVDVHRKGKDSYQAPNYANYLILSNHPDGLPVDSGSRRYLFLQSAISEEEAKALDSEGYFRNLFDTVKAGPGEMRGWLLAQPAHPEFDPNGRAPHTAAKDVVVELSRGDAEQALLDHLKDGVKAFRGDWATGVLKAAGVELPKTRAWNALVSRLGFNPAARRIRVGPRMVRIYRHKSIQSTTDDWLKAESARLVASDFEDHDDE